MTYEEFLAESQKRQRAYIAEERARYERARTEFFHYECRMSDLGLHPLARDRIAGRLDELRRMEARIGETHGDAPARRLLYESRLWEKPGSTAGGS